MKYIIAFVLAISFVTPNYSYAQTQTAAQREVLVQLISSLLKQIEYLQAKLEAQRAEEKVSITETVSKSEYLKKVDPLLKRLDDIEDEIDLLEDKIEREECNKPKWTYVDGRRTFKCQDAEGETLADTEDLREMRDDLVDLEDEKEDIESQVDRLKDRYGI